MAGDRFINCALPLWHDKQCWQTCTRAGPVLHLSRWGSYNVEVGSSLKSRLTSSNYFHRGHQTFDDGGRFPQLTQLQYLVIVDGYRNMRVLNGTEVLFAPLNMAAKGLVLNNFIASGIKLWELFGSEGHRSSIYAHEPNDPGLIHEKIISRWFDCELVRGKRTAEAK